MSEFFVFFGIFHTFNSNKKRLNYYNEQILF